LGQTSGPKVLAFGPLVEGGHPGISRVGNAKALASVDQVHIVDPVAAGDGPWAYGIVAGNAVQRLSILDGVVAGARAFPWMGRLWAMGSWDPQCLTGIDVVAVL